MSKDKLKIAFYWAASCGGCEIAVLDINEKILDVVQIADIQFWPVAMDVKYKDALVKDVNLIVATTNNYPAICMSIRDAAKGLIHGGKVDQGILNKVEMAFRAYDPCFGCATHYAVGQMPLTVQVFNSQKQLVQTLQR